VQGNGGRASIDLRLRLDLRCEKYFRQNRWDLPGCVQSVPSAVPPPLPPLFAKSLESPLWREIPRKILMSKSLDTKLLRTNDLWTDELACANCHGLDHDYAI
jgi:hypothetical protein